MGVEFFSIYKATETEIVIIHPVRHAPRDLAPQPFGGQGRAHIDLPGANRRQLLNAGVTPERIYTSNLCTQCGAAEFHSYRRDGEAAGRMYSYVGIV